MIVHSRALSLELGKTQETALMNIGGTVGLILHSIRIFCFRVQTLPATTSFLYISDFSSFATFNEMYDQHQKDDH